MKLQAHAVRDHCLHPEDYHLSVGASDLIKDITQEDYSYYYNKEEAPHPSLGSEADFIKEPRLFLYIRKERKENKAKEKGWKQ